MIKVVYGSNTIEVPEGTSIEDIKAGLKSIYPEIANATVSETEDGYKFEVKAGTKGSGEITAVYEQNRFNVSADLSDDEIKAALANIYPEIANATATREGNTLTFEVKAGTKGI